MTRHDEMTSNERLKAYFKGEEVDRLPAMPMIDQIGAKVAGKRMRFKRLSAKNQAYVQKRCYEVLGLDGLSIEYGLHGIGAACGTQLDDPENATPKVIHHRMDSIEQVDELDLECVTRARDPWLDLCCRACEILVEDMGEVVGTSASLTGPLTAAASLLPVERFFKAMYKKPELVRKLFRFSTDALKIVCEEFARTGVDIFICDPVASGDMVSVGVYRDWVLPYTREIAPITRAYGVSMGYHICGNTNRITSLMVESGCDMLSIDTKVPLSYAKHVVGHKVPIIGNVDPVDTMMLGSPTDVRHDVLTNIADCMDAPNGYIVATGCDIPIGSSVDNVLQFMDAVREFGPARLGMTERIGA